MSGTDGTVMALVMLPFPWPPPMPRLLSAGEISGQQFEIIALTDGRLAFTLLPARSFISQPIDINSSRPRFEVVSSAWSTTTLSLRISHTEVLPDAPGIPTLCLPPAPFVPDEISISDPNAVPSCQKWIDNRKSKFASIKAVRPNRRPKTTVEHGNDLRASIYRLRDLQQQTLAGKQYLLGTLAGEMRASVYWTQDAKPDRNYNPILLRMASLAELPLPVYFVPRTPAPPVADLVDVTYEPGANAPRIHRMFRNDSVRDLQESLISSVLKLGHSPGRTITALELIGELAHTMGAAHYDEDASEFLDVLSTLRSSHGSAVVVFMCQTADALASLSEWVLSELKTRNLIS